MNDLHVFLENTRKLLLHPYCDLIYLLDHGYPKTSALTFVANHYNLNQIHRNILRRAALPLSEVQTIEIHRIRDLNDLQGATLYVDGYNQLSTYHSLFNQDPLILCRDGTLRDIFSSLHSKKNLQIERKFIESFLLALLHLNPLEVIIWLDVQRSHSKIHANLVQELMAKIGLDGVCEIGRAVDWFLKHETEGIILSHDSVILLTVPRCFDIFRQIHPVPQDSVLNFQQINCQEISFK